MNSCTMNSVGVGSNIPTPRPESIQVNLVERFVKMNNTLENLNSRLLVKADQLVQRPDAKNSGPCDPSLVASCFSDRMYELLLTYERQLTTLENTLVRLEQF
jgi:hypothetical protein